ncbi:hypothetical protein [Metabacillus fastidiosus]|uniref:Lipoprotein n=1 Tax=Metabacillus fastidiosus TaxID=1458 RepID=A0ABU6NY57_9BACI|nr:hypothetical protein [Metabacillus fastidiosus]
MKKYLYAGILVGTIVLAGCNVNEATQKQEKEELTKGSTGSQTVGDKSLSIAPKEEKLVNHLELTQEQKEDYYKQYQQIVNEINSREPKSTLELVPFEGFKSEDFIEPAEFKKFAIERSNWEFK